jgi:hypothetical protein
VERATQSPRRWYAPWARHDVQLSRVDARNPLGVSISSSQLISRRVATARLGRVLHLAADALLPVEGGEVGNGRGLLRVGRWAHITGCEARRVCGSAQSSLLRVLRGVVVEDGCVGSGGLERRLVGMNALRQERLRHAPARRRVVTWESDAIPCQQRARQRSYVDTAGACSGMRSAAVAAVCTCWWGARGC